jgi:DNA-binding transcriptional LysR family regulator
MNKLQAMQLFVRVVETGSFTAAAEQLNLARSMVTRQISALETSLGAKLMTRSTRSLSLTSAGAAYLEKCRVILSLVDAAEADVAQDKAEPRGRIRLGLPLSFGLERLMPLLLDFAQRQPLIRFEMDFSDRRSNLVEEGMDLSIRITGTAASGDIMRQLGTCRLLTLASPAYLAQHGAPRSPDELRHHECLNYSELLSPTVWTYPVTGQMQPSVPVHGRIMANNGTALMLAAAQGMGITRQPDFIAEGFLERGEVVPILSDFEPPPMGIFAVLPSNRYIPHRVRVLMDFLSLALQSNQASVDASKSVTSP